MIVELYHLMHTKPASVLNNIDINIANYQEMQIDEFRYL